MELVAYNPEWENKFEKEAALIRSVLEDEVVDIQHIGSTAIRGILAKPIIDMAILVSEEEYLQAYISPLAKIGYVYYPESSSVERLFFKKGDPAEFHLSLAQENKTTYWQRQIIFRDYLNSHPDLAKEYQQLKENLLLEDPSAGLKYSAGKSEFVKKVLAEAKITGV